MTRRSFSTLTLRTIAVAALFGGLGGIGCGGDAGPQLDIPKGSVNPGGGPPTAKEGKGPTFKSIKKSHDTPPEVK